MNPPVVYIEKEPFLLMVLSSVESFKKECFGFILGRKPTRIRNSFVITSIATIALTKRRRNKEVEQNKLSRKRTQDYFQKYPSLFPIIGDFHSHPEWGPYKREPRLSDFDISDMEKEGLPLGVILKISSLNKERILWENAGDGGVRGSLGNYKFHVNACRVVKEGEQLRDECLLLKAPAAIKSLNRALGYN